MVENARRGTREIRYARTTDAHIAYRVVQGSARGTRDVVLLTSGTLPMDAMFEDRLALRFVEGLAELGRVVLFDRSGIGLSDSRESNTSTLTRWVEDLEAVVNATEVIDPILVSFRLAAGTAMVYCAEHPGTVAKLVLFEPPSWRSGDWDMLRRQIDGEVDSVALWCPSRADDPDFREWFTSAGQRGASPGRAAHAYPDMSEGAGTVIEEAASKVGTPTVVLRRPAHPLSPARIEDDTLALVPGAVRVDLPGEDMFPFGGEVDALIAEIARFVTGEHRLPAPERELAAVLYTDIVSSTARASVLGDARWKRVLDRHDGISRSCIGRRGGTIIKSTGDGVLAILPSATSALRAAQELRAALRQEELEVRTTIHVGDIDRRGNDISGINVVIAARMLDVAGPGDILMSSNALAAIGGSQPIERVGDYEFKGVHGTWTVYSITES